MLVIDIPERRLEQDTFRVRELEEDRHVGPVADRPANQAHEVRHVANVLERVAAAHVIGL